MKHLKMLGLATVAVTILIAFAARDTASAAVSLCSTTTTPCTSEVPTGTTFDFSLKSGTTLKMVTTDGKTTLKTCTSSTIKGALTSATPPTGPISELTWGGCNHQTKTTMLGKLQIDAIAGTDNGTVTADEVIEFTTDTVLFGSCSYGAITGTDLGTLVAGSPATFIVNAVVKKTVGSESACPETAQWTAEYVLTAPAGTTIDIEP